MKIIILACITLIIAVLLADIEILNEVFIKSNMPFLTEQKYILPVFFFFILLTIKNLYDISLYTDETIPLKLSIASLIMAIIGFFVFYRILLLGIFLLIFAAYWNRGIINSYYPKNRIREKTSSPPH